MENNKTPPNDTPAARTPPPGKNRLIFEKSPYLLQHSANPVDWYPWGEGAFEKARREDKPIFLSIGYSTCHWCHVMESESFEDSAVAALMNEAFVNVKVDREERPDVDAIYMSACQMMRGNGGWPLTVIMTPEGKPFFVATYLPKTGRHGLPGMLDLAPQIQSVWRDRRGDVDKVSSEVTERLREVFDKRETASGPGVSTLEAAYASLRGRFDSRYGGFGNAPKFPAPHNLLFLLRYWRRTGEPYALEMVERTLEEMARGGIYDHVGFGFHRYSTDERWFAPHFEKMIYDQALLVMAYTECYLATGKAAYRATAEEVLAYVLRDMTDAAGGFHSAEDADSEGKEGQFYVWTEREILDLLGEEDGRLVIDIFGVDVSGNFAEEVPGGNILHVRRPIEKAAEGLGVTADELRSRLDRIRGVLFESREKRIRPHKDDKILADWNGLMIAALAKAARAFASRLYAKAAESAVDFVMTSMRTPDGRLYHRYRDGEAAVAANVDDYAFLAWGLMELYETTLEPSHLESALGLVDLMDRYHWDSAGGGYFFAPQDGESLIVRTKEIYDGAVPSGNSVAAFVLSRLGRITGDPRHAERAHRIGRVFGREIERAPAAFTFFMAALETSVGPSREIVVVGDPSAADTQAMIRAIRAVYAPEVTLLFKSTREEDPYVTRLAPFTKPHTALGARATAYVCENYACRKPATDVGEVVEALRTR